jgi:hypothetical protein
MAAAEARDLAWPELPYEGWRDTYETLHLWTQIVGKVRLACSPWLNHSWHTALYVTARGLTTGFVPHGAHVLDLEFDFVDHLLHVRSDRAAAAWPLAPMSVAEFYRGVTESLVAVGTPVTISPCPNEVPEATPFTADHWPRTYDAAAANRFFRALVQANRLLSVFRTGFLGKASPVHFFWGGFDLAVTRFSGRRAPLHPGGIPNLPDAVTQEAYSHEVSSAGFWPGGPGCERAAFYSYAYPEPAGFRDTPVLPAAACYDASLGEFVLPYDAVRAAADPDGELLAFLDSTYAAAATAAGWRRAELECDFGRPGRPRPLTP